MVVVVVVVAVFVVSVVVVTVVVVFVRCCSLWLVVARSCSELLFLFGVDVVDVVVDVVVLLLLLLLLFLLFLLLLLKPQSTPFPKSENFQGIKSSSILH